MSGILELDPNSRNRLENRFIRHGFDKGNGLLSIFLVVQRIDRILAVTLPALVLPARFHLLNMGRILEHDLQKITGRRRGIDGPGKPVPDKAGQKPGMIDMGVGQENEFHRIGMIGLDLVEIALFDLLVPLMHAAIHRKPMPARLEDVTRTGHGPGRSDKFNLHTQAPCL